MCDVATRRGVVVGVDPHLRFARVRLGGIALLVAACCILIVGCGGGYQLRGKVIEGPVAQVEVVDGDDPRYLEADRSAGGALIWGVFEPNNGIDRERLGRFVTDGDGMFSIPIDATGAGLLKYEVELTARRSGHQGARGTVALPGRSGRVLITLPRGADTLRVEEDLVDETLRDAERYLEGDR